MSQKFSRGPAMNIGVAHATLRQSLLWLALGREPLEERFEVPEDYPLSVDDKWIKTLQPDDYSRVKKAKQAIAKKLMYGELQAFGDKLVYSVPEEDEVEDESQWSYERVTVPPEFWHPQDILWDYGSQQRRKHPRPNIPSYDNVTIAVADLKRIFPMPLNETISKPEPVDAKGTKYDECEFLRICVWEASRKGLDKDNQTPFIKRMDLLLDVLWEGREKPKGTWMKKTVSAIYKWQQGYERSRRALDDAGSSDQA